jgi:hypothetical protein
MSVLWFTHVELRNRFPALFASDYGLVPTHAVRSSALFETCIFNVAIVTSDLLTTGTGRVRRLCFVQNAISPIEAVPRNIGELLRHAGIVVALPCALFC